MAVFSSVLAARYEITRLDRASPLRVSSRGDFGVCVSRRHRSRLRPAAPRPRAAKTQAAIPGVMRGKNCAAVDDIIVPKPGGQFAPGSLGHSGWRDDTAQVVACQAG
jgi:hypothetical protein